MRGPTTRLLVLLYLLSIVNCRGISARNEDADTKVYIVYLGEKEQDDIERITNSHYDMLEKIVGSKEAAQESMLYSYRHGFSGFSAKLTESQAQQLDELPEVIHVTPSATHKVHTTRTYDHLGLCLSSEIPNDLLHKANMGDGMILGVIDSGIWPESESFSDKGLGPIPSRWRGVCQGSEDGSFDPKMHCNRKLIGARWYMKSLQAQSYIFDKKLYNATANGDFLSPRDGPAGHGTHIASTAAGSIVPNVTYKGQCGGTLRGAAPKARIASYKVCWQMTTTGLTCEGGDILAGIDMAIRDGVDVIQVSLGDPSLPVYFEGDKHNGIAIGSYHAILKGITVVAAAGNNGPVPGTVSNVAPWEITVGASTIDRSFPTPIVLENNITLLGQALLNGIEGSPYRIYKESILCNDLLSTPEEKLEERIQMVNGNMVMCFTSESALDVLKVVGGFGGIGLILSNTLNDITHPSTHDSPFLINMNYEEGSKLYRLLQANKKLEARVGPTTTLVGKAVPISVAYFSSRGPSTIAQEILKPDIIAPGSNVLGAVPTTRNDQENGYALMSGTSQAAPHVSGIALLLRAIHPDWSPAVIKSAFTTTGRVSDEFGYPLFTNGCPRKLADPFDYGGGIVNPNGAVDPGLVYEIFRHDYINYLCGMGYRKATITRLIDQPAKCPKKRPRLLDINLPSMTIPSLRNTTTLTRTVTNVGPVNSIYKAEVNPPDGTDVLVKPDVLVFNSNVRTISFTVTVAPTHKVNLGIYNFGSLTWVDGVHSVRSPISVKLHVLGSHKY